MHLTLFQIINYALVLLLLILFIRYQWLTFFQRGNQPVQWQHAIKSGSISAKLKKIERNYPDKVRFYNWWFQIERLSGEKVSGAFVELGVYEGESAAIIHQMDPGRRFHLFDTFTGFPASDLEGETGEAASYTPNHFADTSMNQVLQKINGNHNIIMYPGQFPQSAHKFSEQVALVNMDADLYRPTRSGLDFFYPLLSPGGVIIVHDYNYRWPGVIQAVDEFIQNVPENLIYLPDRDGTVMIIRNK